ncbi:hypothetical protein [Crocosphaera sp.]|uniref:arginine synthesis PII-interacting regulator PirA n=1 Tax=Crocosphaera sp. TaxID=2729996 RepID=UPI00261C0DEA|nr:hypothetical protein [Crocosphaera sp.]MDJ0580006.1 hypothetical protein [Crocosphaera sp.]
MLEVTYTMKFHKSMFTMSKNSQQTITQAIKTHRDSLRKSLQHRLEVARSSNNHYLVRQLEAEAAYLHL